MASKDKHRSSLNNNSNNNSSSNTGAGVTTYGGGDSSAVDLTCPVCYDTFRSPRFLPCHHTLCSGCIADLMERATQEPPTATDDLHQQQQQQKQQASSSSSFFFLCPLCQVRVPVPEDGVTSFQVNFYLAPFLSGRVSTSFTPEQLRDGAPRKTPDSSPGSSFDLSCEAHWTGEWSHYCRLCSCLVCRPSCPQHQGPDHHVVPVTSEAPTQRSEVRRQLLSLTTLQGALADLEEECRHRVTALEDSCRQVVLRVDSTRQQVCGALAARADKAAEKVQGMRGRIGQVVQGEMRSLQEKRASLAALLTSARDALAGTDAEFLRQSTKLRARIQSGMSKIPPSRGHLQFSFQTSPALQALLGPDQSSGGGFGHMTLQFQSPVLRHRMTLSSTKQQRKLRKLCPRGDGSGTMLASVGNCLVTLTGDFAEAKRLEFPGEVVDFAPARDGMVYVVLPFPHAVKRLDTATDVAADFVSPLHPPTAMACTDKRELVFASHDGKELSLTFYHESGARLKRVTLPRPDFTPASLAVSKQGHLFLGSASELVCLDPGFSEAASLCGAPGLRPRCLTSLRGVGAGLGHVLMANGEAGNVEIVELSWWEQAEQEGGDNPVEKGDNR